MCRIKNEHAQIEKITLKKTSTGRLLAFNGLLVVMVKRFVFKKII